MPETDIWTININVSYGGDLLGLRLDIKIVPVVLQPSFSVIDKYVT